MREEWYVVPARYAFKLREVADAVPAGDGDDLDSDDLIEGLHTAASGDDPNHEPPAPRHLPRKSSGHLKR